MCKNSAGRTGPDREVSSASGSTPADAAGRQHFAARPCAYGHARAGR